VITVPLLQEKNFALDVEGLLKAITPDVKIVFLCSPNNPTGQLLERSSVLRIISTLATRAIVAVDEAYVEFSGQPSLAAELSAHPNLVVLRTLSKAYGLAGARVGVTLGSPEIIAVLQKVIAPYPLPAPVVTAVQRALSPEGLAAMHESTQLLISERERLLAALPKIPAVKRVWPSHANYILIETGDSTAVMATGRSAGIVWRDRNNDVRNNVRITIGTPDENNATLEALARV
jgi:histidinol-phosphate aminotransferase